MLYEVITEKATDEVKKATNGLGAMAIIDLVGTDATLAMAARMARKQGQIVVVGLGGGTFPFRTGALPFGCALVTTLGGSTSELGEVVALAEARITSYNVCYTKLLRADNLLTNFSSDVSVDLVMDETSYLLFKAFY